MLTILLVGQLLISLKLNALVQVDPSVYSVTREADGSALPPLGERRGGWGFTVGAGAGYYSPNAYEPSYITDTFENTYGANKTPMMDVQMQFKKNMRRASIGVDLGGGFYSNTSTSNGVSSQVSFNPVRLGLTLTLDGLFAKPYVAPYASLGGYTTFYRESQSSVSYGGNTQIAVYYAFGAMFLMDWMDQKSADNAFSETGLQATYLYAEGRQYMKSNSTTDPDLSTGIDPNVGLRLEF